MRAAPGGSPHTPSRRSGPSRLQLVHGAADLRDRERVRRDLHDAGPAAPDPDEVARYLFRRVVAWGRSSNVFLGKRLPASTSTWAPTRSTPRPSATPSVSSSFRTRRGSASSRGSSRTPGPAARRRGGGRDLRLQEQHRLRRQLLRLSREIPLRAIGDFQRVSDMFIPFLISVRSSAGPARWSRRPTARASPSASGADHIWEGVSSATTRSRPIINTRDEPLADAEKYRRLHVIVGDSTCPRRPTCSRWAAPTSCCG